MAQAIWKGQVSFGLLNVPVSLYSGEARNDVKLRMLDNRNDARVRYERVNEETGETVPWKEIIKAYEYDKGRYVKIDPDELQDFLTEANNTVELDAFIDADDLDPRFYQKPYYLVPQKKFEKGYVLLRESLADSGMIGIARVVIRTRNHLAAVIPYENALILNVLRFCEDVRALDNFNFPSADAADYRISGRELKMSLDLINSMKTRWDPEDYHDEYRKRLLEYVEQKISEGEARPKEAPAAEREPSSNVVDLQELLRQSLARKKAEPRRNAAQPSETGGRDRSGSGSKAAKGPSKAASARKKGAGSASASGRKRKTS